MAILNLNLDLDKEYIQLIKDLYKIIVILAVFQTIMHYSNCNKNIITSAFTGTILNDDFMTILIYLIISISAYYLVFDKLLNIE
jgi:riboflavin transporter FmnP